jgi:signal peptidase I
MSTVAAADAALSPESAPTPRYSRWRLTAGLLGRSWLWFLAGCLLVTFVPILFGWRPYVIESGSMAPKIKVGDVVLASPENDPQKLLGHVATFDDPDRPGRVKSHRVIKINDNGTLQTKGDANPTPDAVPLPVSSVRGLDRLLVRWVGLPLIWAQTGRWLLLLLFLASLAVAAAAVATDHEPDEPDDPDDADDSDGPAGEQPHERPRGAPAAGATQIAASKPFKLPGWMKRSWGRSAWGGLARNAALVGLGSALLLLPTTLAAFAATTSNGTQSWSVPNWDYTTQVNALGPYLYWKLDETGTTTASQTAADSSGNGHTGQYNGNGTPNVTATYFTRGVNGAMITDTPDSAVTLNNANSCINTVSNTLITAPAAVTVMIWFKTSAGYSQGGKLAGFEKPRVGVAAPSTGTYDRMLYMDGNGKVWFGVYNGAYVTLGSTGTLNDGNWHMAVGTVGATGTRLYIDGVLNAANAANTAAEATTGVWRAGCGNLAGWGGSWGGANNPTTDSTVVQNRPFLGSLDEFTVYTSELSATNIQFLSGIT